MSSAEPRISQFLSAIRTDGRSSPAGMHWHDFWIFLVAKGGPNETKPPVPLILAASAESNGSKHSRLAAQLEWARAHGCLDEAIGFLEQIPNGNWNTGTKEAWEQSSYMSPGDE